VYLDFESIRHTLVVAVAAYVSLVVILRLAGKRVLSKWNAFDLVITVALGSCLATTVVSSQTSWAQGVTAFVALVLLQMFVTKLSVWTKGFESFVKARPRLLLLQGAILEDALRSERVSEAEILSAVRLAGAASLSEIGAIILETDGSFSVVKDLGADPATALADVEGYEVLRRDPEARSFREAPSG
jgi:uncharacterized membrane protein YcaP (DUF421 family)